MTDLLEVMLDSWDRNNAIVVNLLRALPEEALQAKPMADSPSIAELFAHMHYVRLVFVQEDAPEFAIAVPDEWTPEPDRNRFAQMLNESARVVRAAVEGRVKAGKPMDRRYDDPILFLQHMIWHEGYHHGQIKLALKLTGRPMSDKQAGPITWALWTRKKAG